MRLFLLTFFVASILIYGVSRLRAMARKNQLSGTDIKERILDLPLSVEDYLEIFSANEEKLKATFGEDDATMYGTALLSLQEKYSQQTHGDNVAKAMSVEVFDDENSNSELVYSIGVNHLRKRILLTFRGTVTVKDFMVDADSYMCQFTNPMSETGETIGIHHGFYGKNRRKHHAVLGDCMFYHLTIDG